MISAAERKPDYASKGVLPAGRAAFLGFVYYPGVMASTWDDGAQHQPGEGDALAPEHRSELPGVQGLCSEHCRCQWCWRKGNERSSGFSDADHQQDHAPEDACDEDKLQKSCGRTKAAYKAAAEQLTPAEQVQAAFDLDQLANKVSSESEFEEESSLNFLQEGEVEQALLDENEIVLSIEKTSYNLFLYITYLLL